jgi:Cu(I)/Ag(I) efflux system membrane protein CusA/SilA
MNKVIAWCVEQRILMLGILAVFVGLCVFARVRIPIDAIPDVSENQVIVMTNWPGQTPQNVEDQVTYPLSIAMQGVAGVHDVRAMSQLGVSMVTVIFDDDVDLYFARDRVSEQLQIVQSQLPPGAMPMLGPDATGLGQIYMYTLKSDHHTLTELRSLQDFTVKYALQEIPGIAEIASIGGYEKRYQIIVDPAKLATYELPLTQLMETVQMSNQTVSGRVVDIGGSEVAIQGIGFFESIDDIQSLVLGQKTDGTPLLVRDVALVREGGAFRRSLLADADQEQVGGIVIMRYGENPIDIIEQVDARIERLHQQLPEGVHIEPFYDRSPLIREAIRSMDMVLILELVVTAIVLGVFLYHIGTALVTVVALILGVLFAYGASYVFGIPMNIMSLGGIAIAVGTMVDAAIVVSEQIFQSLREKPEATEEERRKRIIRATQHVARPLIFAIGIIILSFLPILGLQGMEGKLFRPLAYTNAFAMFGALVAAIIFVPVLATWWMKAPYPRDEDVPVAAWCERVYTKWLTRALQFKKRTIAASVLVFLVALGLATQIGSEFMPPLDEGSIMYMPMTVPDVSEKKAQELLLETNQIIASIPEVEQVVGKAGRANTATDPAPLAMLETFITLKPRDEWRKGVSKADIIQEMNRTIQIDQLWNGFTQPIIGRIDMLATGIRAEVGIKVFGDDPTVLEDIALQIEDRMAMVPGASGVAAIRTTGLPYLQIDLREDKLAQHGVMKMDALATIASGVGGHVMTQTIEGRERYGVEVRLEHSWRDSLEDIASLLVVGRHGNLVPLRSIADINLEDGPSVIQSEQGIMRSAVQMNVVGTDLGSFVQQAKEVIAQDIELPEGYSVEFSGQFEHQLRASKRLMIVVPMVLVLIFVLLYLTYKDLGLVSIVMLSIPLGMAGGLIALFVSQLNLSVAVWVGLISLFGNVVETGIVIMVYLEESFQKHFVSSGSHNAHRLTEAIIHGATKRLRPILMTAATSVIGLLPLLVATGVGIEVQRPLAIVVVGGLITSIALTLFVMPVLFYLLRARQYQI